MSHLFFYLVYYRSVSKIFLCAIVTVVVKYKYIEYLPKLF